MGGYNTTATMMVMTTTDDDDDVECSPRVNFEATTQNRSVVFGMEVDARAIRWQRHRDEHIFSSRFYFNFFFLNRKNGFVNVVDVYSLFGFVRGLSLCVRMEFSFIFFSAVRLEFIRDNRKRWRKKCGRQDFCPLASTIGAAWAMNWS